MDPSAERRRPRPIDDAEVALAFYGSIVYLAVVSSLASQHPQPEPTVAVGAVISTATVLFIAHTFAAVVPKAARAGRLHRHHLLEVLRHDAPLLVTCAVPVIPLALAAWDVVPVDTGYRFSVRLTLGLLLVLAIGLGRRDGLAWKRAVGAGITIIVITAVVIWLESLAH